MTDDVRAPRAELVRPASLFAGSQYAYAAVVPAGARLVLTAGACPLDEDGSTAAVGDVGGQAERVMANLRTTLRQAGCDWHDVVRTTVYVASSDREELVTAWRVVKDALAPHDPPSTLVGVTVLGYPEQLVEVEATAVAPAAE